jgi:alginate O-acetyltransferase complex protein AlgJ
MKKPFRRRTQRLLGALLLSPLILISSAQAADPAPGIAGKNDWLYYRYELSDANDLAATNASLDLIARLNRVLARNGVTLAVAMVPLKMRIYPENLPAELKVSDYLAGNYDRFLKTLQAAQVQTLDLNTAFLNSPKRSGDAPFFLRLDTHWSPAGAMQAAESIRAGIDANPALKKLFDAIPEEKFSLAWGKRKIISKARDLAEQLPKGAASPAPEQLLPFSVTRLQPPKENLLGEAAAPGIALMGSSYSDSWTGFPEALRFTLQRDILDISVGADRGSWVGIESYLRDDAFQTQKPKILIWEMPERDMKALPNYQYRDARYLSDNTEWLLRAASWVENNCAASPVRAKLTGGVGTVTGNNVSSGPTKDDDAIEVSFDPPLTTLDYLSANLTLSGSKNMILVASGAGVTTRRFSMTVADDGAPHAFKTPLPSGGAGFTKLRILPGKTKTFALKDLKVCRHPDSLLK